MIAQNTRVGIVEAMLAAAKAEAAGIVAARDRGACSASDAEGQLRLLSAQVEFALTFTRTGQSSSPPPSRRGLGQRYGLATPRRILPARLAGPAVAVALVAAAVGWWWTAPRSPSIPAIADSSSKFDADPVGTSSRPTASAKADPVAALAEEWLEAYLGKDDARVAELSAQAIRVSDERLGGERLPVGAGHRAWTVVDTTVQHHGSVAVVTAKVIETGEDPVTGRPLQVETFTSQLLTNRGGTWLVSEARIVSAAAVERGFR